MHQGMHGELTISIRSIARKSTRAARPAPLPSVRDRTEPVHALRCARARCRRCAVAACRATPPARSGRAEGEADARRRLEATRGRRGGYFSLFVQKSKLYSRLGHVRESTKKPACRPSAPRPMTPP